MKKYRQPIQGERFFTIVLILFCSVFLGMAAWTSEGSSQNTTSFQSKQVRRNSTERGKAPVEEDQQGQVGRTIKTITLAPGFKFIKVTGSREAGFQLELRNGYDKAITAFDMGFIKEGVISAMTRELIYNNKVVAPGETWTEWHLYEPSMDTAALTVFAVVFEDGDSDGRRQSVKAIKDMRLGHRLQMGRFEPMLKAALDSPDSELLDALNKLEDEISSLSVKEDASLSEYVKSALHSEKFRLLRRIRDVKNRGLEGIPLRQELNRFKQDNAERTAKLTRSAVQ